MKIEKHVCDICKAHVAKDDSDHIDVRLQVIFTTEQTEGRSTTPYLFPVKVDVCDDCMATILQGNYVYASGAQGANKYWLGARSAAPAPETIPTICLLEELYRRRPCIKCKHLVDQGGACIEHTCVWRNLFADSGSKFKENT